MKPNFEELINLITMYTVTGLLHNPDSLARITTHITEHCIFLAPGIKGGIQINLRTTRPEQDSAADTNQTIVSFLHYFCVGDLTAHPTQANSQLFVFVMAAAPSLKACTIDVSNKLVGVSSRVDPGCSEGQDKHNSIGVGGVTLPGCVFVVILYSTHKHIQIVSEAYK